jgi:hypothetical protein
MITDEKSSVIMRGRREVGGDHARVASAPAVIMRGWRARRR